MMNPFLVVVKRAILLHSTLLSTISPVWDSTEEGDKIEGFRVGGRLGAWRRRLGSREKDFERRWSLEFGRKWGIGVKVEEGFGGEAGRGGELWRVGRLSHYESGFGHVTMLLGLPKEKEV